MKSTEHCAEAGFFLTWVIKLSLCFQNWKKFTKGIYSIFDLFVNSNQFCGCFLVLKHWVHTNKSQLKCRHLPWTGVYKMLRGMWAASQRTEVNLKHQDGFLSAAPPSAGPAGVAGVGISFLWWNHDLQLQGKKPRWIVQGEIYFPAVCVWRTFLLVTFTNKVFFKIT